MKNRKPFECRKCGERMYRKSLRTGGWWVQVHNADGSMIETDLNGVKTSGEPKTVTCVQCGCRQPNPDRQEAGE